MPDKTKYLFNNKEYGKGRLVLAVVQQYDRDNSPRYSELKQQFPDSLQGGLFVVISEEELSAKYKNSNDTRVRYFDGGDDQIHTLDTKKVFVSNQWGAGNINNFIDRATQLGYEIQQEDKVMKSIRERFDDYKKNPRTNWIKLYRQRCQQLSAYKGKLPEDYDVSLLRDIWELPDNSVANASPGFLSKAEFKNLLNDLPAITSKIVQSPTPGTLDAVMDWARQAQRAGKFNTIKKGVIHRVFAAADPVAYSSILKRAAVIQLINQLNRLYGLTINNEGNWAELNIGLMKGVKSQGLENEDVFEVNTFVWTLFESLASKEPENNNGANGDLQVSMGGGTTCKNIIYYGPPGTGKTFHLQDLLKKHYTDKGNQLDEQLWLRNEVENLKWYELIILILIDSNKPLKVAEVIAHEYYQIKAELNDRNAHLSNTAWSSLNSHTINESSTVNSAQRIDPLVFDKNNDSSWFLVDSVSDQIEEYKKLYQRLKAGPAIEDSIQRFKFVTFHQSYGYEEFIEGLRPETNANGDISYIVRQGVFKSICQLAEKDPEHQYAMVIDEINRGNISKIFGELITLIEVDKRAGCDNELTLTLPYSGSTFSVPSNLDIIGTMNTADRSLTHIDVALRRRFDFTELRTDYSHISENIDGINLKRMLYAINQRIELLLDREHILGHALLMRARSISDIEHAFKTAIMPLLQEYFFENWDKINRVLNDNGFVEEQKNAYDIWLGNADDYTARSYRINFDAMQQVDAYQSIYSGVDDSAFAQMK